MEEVYSKVMEVVNSVLYELALANDKLANIESDNEERNMKEFADCILVTLENENDLESAGFDSIAFIRTIVALEEAFDIEFPDEVLTRENMNTIEDISNITFSLINAKVTSE